MAARRSPFVIATLLGIPSVALAQLDYRNLDDDRPTLIEDAYPLERYGFEILAPWRYSRAQGGGGVHAFIPELEYGLFGNFQLGLKAPIARVETTGGHEWGIAGLRLFGLYNFNTEGAWLPAPALRADATFPVGGLAGEGTRFTAKAIATRSWGQSRVHLNGAYTFGADRLLAPAGAPHPGGVAGGGGADPCGADRLLAAADAAHKWWLGGAVDRTLFRQSTLLIVELYALRPAASE